MAKFIIKHAQAKPNDFVVQKSIIGLDSLELHVSLELVSSGDFSEYINENNTLDKERIIKDIVSGKIKINE